MLMNENAIAELSKLLSLKFWFGGKFIYPWVHPMNGGGKHKRRAILNCAAITLDGCLQYRFKVHKNGKLRCINIRSTRYLDLKLRRMQTLTFQELRNRIALQGEKLSVPYLQTTSPTPVPVDMDAWKYLMKAKLKALLATK